MLILALRRAIACSGPLTIMMFVVGGQYGDDLDATALSSFGVFISTVVVFVR